MKKAKIFNTKLRVQKEQIFLLFIILLGIIRSGERSASWEERAYLAGGCFWGIEYYMEDKEGVLSAISGYAGGSSQPTYKEVKSGRSGHLEVVEIIFNSSIISFEEILKYFMEIHDPWQKGGQGTDIGEQYNSAVFYVNEEQRMITERVIALLGRERIQTRVLPFKAFYIAEDYHQDYYKRVGTLPQCHGYTQRFFH